MPDVEPVTERLPITAIETIKPKRHDRFLFTLVPDCTAVQTRTGEQSRKLSVYECIDSFNLAGQDLYLTGI